MNQPTNQNSPKSKSPDKVSLLIIAILIFIAGFSFGDRSHTIFNCLGKTLGIKINQSELDFSLLNQTYETLKKKYDGEIKLEDLIHGANKGLVDSLGDRHSVYLTPKEAEEFNKNLSGEVGGGIGAEVGVRKNLITIIRPLKNNPAFEAGLLAGDVVYKVDDEEIAGQTLDQVIQKIRGIPGTDVKLTVLRQDQTKPIEITITRQIINNPSVSMETKNGVAILTVSRFDQQTASLARKEIQTALTQGIKKVVLDLRGNSGGYLTAAQELASLWIDGQLVVSEKVGDKTIQEFFSKKGDTILGDVKTVILANAGSASASEIVIGALRDYGKATVIGETTFGKGSVQELVNLKNGGQLKVTIARWYTPKGKNIDQIGIKPDQEVELSADDWQNNNDPQLDAALKFLNK